MVVPPALTEGAEYPRGSNPFFHAPNDPESPNARRAYQYTENQTPYADDYVPMSKKSRVQGIVEQNRSLYPGQALLADTCKGAGCSISGGKRSRRRNRKTRNKSRRSRR
jgi:hypothetical protein